MRYLTAALALAFALAVSVAQACPYMKTAQTPAQVASTGEQEAPPSTKIRIPTPPKG
jgi:hypothetical protein